MYRQGQVINAQGRAAIVIDSFTSYLYCLDIINNTSFYHRTSEHSDLSNQRWFSFNETELVRFPDEVTLCPGDAVLFSRLECNVKEFTIGRYLGCSYDGEASIILIRNSDFRRRQLGDYMAEDVREIISSIVTGDGNLLSNEVVSDILRDADVDWIVVSSSDLYKSTLVEALNDYGCPEYVMSLLDHPINTETQQSNRTSAIPLQSSMNNVFRDTSGFFGKYKFGVELEGIISISPKELKDILNEAGIPVLIDTSTSTAYNDTWKITSDGSISVPFTGGIDGVDEEEEGEYDDDYREWGVELVSPPLRGEAGVKQLNTVFEALDVAGWRQNSSCGCHIHIDGERMLRDGKRIRTLLWLMGVVELELIKCMKHRREYSSYCKPINREILEDSALSETMAEMVPIEYYRDSYYRSTTPDMDYKYNERRYYGLNLHSLWYRGTVEFRYFHTPDTVDECLAFIAFCINVMQIANDKDLRILHKIYNACDVLEIMNSKSTNILSYLVPECYMKYFTKRTNINGPYYSLDKDKINVLQYLKSRLTSGVLNCDMVRAV